jgi:hypothetical protein
MNVIQIKELEAGVALDWYKKSWKIFQKNSALFVLQFFMFFMFQMAAQLLGPLSTLASNVLWCLFIAGLFYTCDKIGKGEEVSFSDFFKGFDKNTKPLVILGLYLSAILFVYIAFVIIMVILIGGLSILSYINNPQEIVDYLLSNFLISIFILTLVVLIPLTILLMASIFSPGLVFFENLKPLDAMKKSLIACVHNSMAFLMHGLWFFLFSILASIPLGLGFIILLPIVNLTIYFAYKDIFPSEPASIING